MKIEVWLAFCLALMTTTSFAQGTIYFNNRAGSVDAPVSRPDGTGAGAGVSAGLFLVEQGIYTPLFPTTVFRATSPAASFYVVQPSEVIVPGHDVLSTVTEVMRSWDGPTYETSTWYGQSNPVTIQLGGTPQDGRPPVPSTLLLGLQGYVLVPEPSTTGLGVSAAAVLFIQRRRNL